MICGVTAVNLAKVRKLASLMIIQNNKLLLPLGRYMTC